MLEQVTNTVTDNVSMFQAVIAVLTVALYATIRAGVSFVSWLVKRKITKAEETEEKRGPVLYKLEHDKDCEDWRINHDQKADEKHNQIIAGLSEVKGSVANVHKRLDAHLEAEATRR
jgi:uncharacterized membrane protein YkoI